MKGKIYIAGPMRGIRGYNYKAFFLAQDRLEMANWEVINPAEVDAEKYGAGIVFNMKDTLLDDLKEVTLRADAIFMLEGWEKSDGARAEYFTARAIGLKVYFQSILDASVWEREGDAHEPA